MMNVKQLEELGFSKAAKKVGKKIDLKNKLMIAYEHYRFVTPGIFDRFQKQIKDKTWKVIKGCPRCNDNDEQNVKNKDCSYCQGTGAQEATYDKLSFTPISVYEEVPPPDCLMDLKKAKDMGCFDYFEVAKVETVEVRPDPIIFGGIEGCDDKFFITQWDDDVSIEEILNENEG